MLETFKKSEHYISKYFLLVTLLILIVYKYYFLRVTDSYNIYSQIKKVTFANTAFNVRVAHACITNCCYNR